MLMHIIFTTEFSMLGFAYEHKEQLKLNLI